MESRGSEEGGWRHGHGGIERREGGGGRRSEGWESRARDASAGVHCRWHRSILSFLRLLAILSAALLIPSRSSSHRLLIPPLPILLQYLLQMRPECRLRFRGCTGLC